MKTPLVALASVLVAASIGAQPTPLPPFSGDKAEVNAVHHTYAQNWNRHNVDALAAMWTEDGDYTEPDGRTAFGREEILRLLKIEHGSVFNQSHLDLLVERVRIVGNGVAVADGTYELLGAKDPNGHPIGMRSGYFTTVLVKQDGQWKVSAARLMLPQVLIWRKER
jgi:uncharacterized protein (TIGR02246 family)